MLAPAGPSGPRSAGGAVSDVDNSDAYSFTTASSDVEPTSPSERASMLLAQQLLQQDILAQRAREEQDASYARRLQEQLAGGQHSHTRPSTASKICSHSIDTDIQLLPQDDDTMENMKQQHVRCPACGKLTTAADAAHGCVEPNCVRSARNATARGQATSPFASLDAFMRSPEGPDTSEDCVLAPVETVGLTPLPEFIDVVPLHINSDATSRGRRDQAVQEVSAAGCSKQLFGGHDEECIVLGQNSQHLGNLTAGEEALQRLWQQEAQAAAERRRREESDAAMAAMLAEQEHCELELHRAEWQAREQLDAAAARELEEEEQRVLEEMRRTKQAQAVADLEVARLLDAVSERTGLDVADLDRAAAIEDHAPGATFECPILFIECSKREEGECVGQWHHLFCNHWVSRDALTQYIVTEAEEGRFSFRCPVCISDPCYKCATHGMSQRETGCCYIPPKQWRRLLSSEQLERVLELQEKNYRTVHRDAIVQCPHPECQFFYVLGPGDREAAEEPAAQGAQDGVAGTCRWPEGRDMWCKRCEIQYCLHCGEKMGTLVKWHNGKTCSQFLQEAANAKAAAERKKLEAQANAGHEQNRGKTWQRCAKCRYEAWKPDDQCNRVICKCGANFCFLCGTDISSVKYGHFSDKGHPCYAKVWHVPLGGTEGRPHCKCEACRKQIHR